MTLEQQIKDLTQELLRLDREMMNLMDSLQSNQFTDSPEMQNSRKTALIDCIDTYFLKEQALEALMQQLRGASNV
jgi:dynactin complex subunit